MHLVELAQVNVQIAQEVQEVRSVTSVHLKSTIQGMDIVQVVTPSVLHVQMVQHVLLALSDITSHQVTDLVQVVQPTAQIAQKDVEKV